MRKRRYKLNYKGVPVDEKSEKEKKWDFTPIRLERNHSEIFEDDPPNVHRVQFTPEDSIEEIPRLYKSK